MPTGGLRTKGITKSSIPDAPLISVITVVYNGAATLEQTIRSVLRQTYGNVEYLIIDGGSTDGTLDIIRRYEDEIDWWQSGPDGGIYDAMNRGIALATGDYVYVLGCDDFLVDENVLSGLRLHLIQGYDVICGTVWAVNRNGWQFEFNNNYGSGIGDDLRYGISAPHQGIFIRRPVMERYPFDTKYRIAADYKLNLCLWTDGGLRIKKVRDKVAYYSVDGTSGKSVALRRAESFEILKEFGMEASGRRLLDGDALTRFVKRIIPDERLRLRLKITLGRVRRHSCGWSGCPYCGGQER